MHKYHYKINITIYINIIVTLLIELLIFAAQKYYFLKFTISFSTLISIVSFISYVYKKKKNYYNIKLYKNIK